jgi:4-amino-4-deoxychorismate lyase
MEFAVDLGVSVRVGELPLERLMDADEIMLVNSVIGVWRVREFNGRVWGDGGLTGELRAMVEERDD